ncbi:MAG: fimbrillin family protein [Mucinivorans sp.]
MVRKIHIALLFALAGMVCVACVPERIVEPIPEGRQEISFAPPTATDPTADQSASRATIATADNLPSFGVFASLGNTWDAATSTPNYIYNSKVIKVGTTTWRCDPPQYWPPAASGSLSFFAYAPYAPAGLTFSAATVAGIPTLTYQTPEAVDEQVDLLFAAPAYNQVYSSTQNVPMNFTHILSAITFSAKLTATLAADFSRLSVRGVAISGLNTQGTYTYGTPAGAWVTVPGTSQIYSVSVDGGQLVEKILTTTAQSISEPSKIMIAIPQTIPAAAKIAVRMQYYADGSPIPQELTVEKQLNASGLTALAIANKYNIVLSVSLGTLNDVNVSYSVIPWTDGGTIIIPPIN